MRIAYFSDVHLEFGSCPFPEHGADIVVAAGDIAPGNNALPWLAQAKDIPIIYIAGNHEYYGNDITATLSDLRFRSAEMESIHFLEKDVFEYQGTRFLGTTLWSDLDYGDPETMCLLEEQMNDFSYIRCGYRKMTAQDMLHMHVSSLYWLINQLETTYPGPTVVVTHHAPSMKSWHLDTSESRRHGYCSNLDYLVSRYAIDLWLHGHTHTRREYPLGENTRVGCNARGYYGLDTKEMTLQPEIVTIGRD